MTKSEYFRKIDHLPEEMRRAEDGKYLYKCGYVSHRPEWDAYDEDCIFYCGFQYFKQFFHTWVCDKCGIIYGINFKEKYSLANYKRWLLGK